MWPNTSAGFPTTKFAHQFPQLPDVEYLLHYTYLRPSHVLQDGRTNIFFRAEKEIAKMLAENLLENFKATSEYKELAGDMVFETG